MADKIGAISYLPFEAILSGLINYKNKRGSLKAIEVTPTTDKYYESAGLHQTPEELLRALVDVDDNGDYAIRIGFHTDAGSTKFTPAAATQEVMLRSLIGKASDGKPYLRIVLQEL